MRIVGGEARGRQIRIPRGCRIRPTADRVKESLFAILGPLEGCSFLDLFAGSGNVGIEAISRGASPAVFVEQDRRVSAALRVNLQSLGMEGTAEVITADVRRGIGELLRRHARFDVLFADPPYDEGLVGECLRWLEGGELLTAGGIVVMQHSVREPLEGAYPQTLATLAVSDQRRYGDTMLSFLKSRTEGRCP
ncbi:MAG: 16S rRNA (guanine(966)-N(2))-methyltransferase RsmD [Syntrophales bacterium]